MLYPFSTFCPSLVALFTIMCLCYLFKSRHQIVTLCNICHLGLFILLYSHRISHIKVELMVFLFLVAALCHCFIASLKASPVSLDYITVYLFLWIYFHIIDLLGWLCEYYFSCFDIFDDNSSWSGNNQDECLTLSILKFCSQGPFRDPIVRNKILK